MADATIGALRIILGMDTAQFEDNAKKASKGLDGFAKRMTEIAAGIGLEKAISGAARALVDLTFRAIDSADKIGKAAQKFGVGVEELSALTYAAELSDVSLETLGKSLTIVSKNMSAVAGGTTNIAAAAFNNLGISVKTATGSLKSAEDIFLDVAEQFANMRDGATKTALAVAIFGRAGAELIPLLNQGRDGIKTLTDEARRLGIVIDEKTAKSAENFNDNLKRLGKVQDAIILKILGSGGLLSAIEQVSFRMIESANDAAKWESASNFLAKALEAASTWVLILAKAVDFLTLPVQAIILAFVRLKDLDFSGAWEAIKDSMGRAIPNLKEIFNLITKGQEDVSLFTEILRHVQEQLDNVAKIKFEPKPFSEKQFELGEKFADTLKKIKVEAAETRGEFNNLAPGFVAQAQHFKDLDGFGKSYGTTLASLTPLQLKLNAALQEMALAKLSQEFLTPWQQYEQQMIRLNALFPEGQRNVELYQLAALKAAATVAAAYGTAAQGIVSPMAQAFKDLASINKRYAGIAKAAAIAEATINTFVAASKALAQGGVLGFATAAAVTAAGLANVAKISATEFASGGSFRVPGGVSGVDNRFVPLMLSSGEQVDITPAGQASSQRGSTVNITLQGDSVSRNQLRDLFNTINSGIRDGYRIKMA